MRHSIDFDLSSLQTTLSLFARLNVAGISKDPLIQIKLKKISLQATKVLSVEQLMRILVGLLELQVNYNIKKVGQVTLKTGIHELINAIEYFFDQEGNTALKSLFDDLFNQFSLENEISEKDFYEKFNILFEKHVSCVDLDFVMQAAMQARNVRTTLGKHAILVLGKTGAGKSFVINYIACPKIFRRDRTRIFGHKLKVDIKNQPKFLQHIKIGESVVSETSEMGVVDVDLIKHSGMEKFHGQGYVLCDTPGAADNRNLGPELKLANALQTIAPMSRARSVRFLVLISAQATSARGEEFKDTIKFIAKMFAGDDADTVMREASASMVFAINGDEGRDNLPDFKRQLNEFYDNRYTLGFDEKAVALINILKQKFKQNEVLLVRPGKDNTTDPVGIMTQLHACKGISPARLNPFSEDSIAHKLESESSLVTSSIDRIFKLLQTDLPTDVMQRSVNRLTVQFEKLSFLDSYYQVNRSNIVPYFGKLAQMIGHLHDDVLAILCPVKGKIQLDAVLKAIARKQLIGELDRMIRVLAYVLFANNRERVIELINALHSSSIQPSVDYKKLDNASWYEWLEPHRPVVYEKEIDDKIQAYRLSQVKKLKGLLSALQTERAHQQTQHLLNLKAGVQPEFEFAELVQLNNKHTDVKAYLATGIDALAKGEDNYLEALLGKLETKLKEDGQHYANGVDFISTLEVVVHNLTVQDCSFRWLFNEEAMSNAVAAVASTPVATNGASAFSAPTAPPLLVASDGSERDPYSIDVLQEELKSINAEFQYGISQAIDNRHFTKALRAIDQLEKFYKIFSFNGANIINDFVSRFYTSFLEFVNTTIALIKNKQVDIQLLMLNFQIMQSVVTQEKFNEYSAVLGETRSAELQLAMKTLSESEKDRFTEFKVKVLQICKADYSKDDFPKFDILIQQLWYSLSLPSCNRSELVDEYKQTVQAIREFCANTIGRMSGQLKVDLVPSETYQEIKVYLDQFSSSAWVSVLQLLDAENHLKVELTSRAKWLIDGINNSNFDFGHEAGLAKYACLSAELTMVLEMFSDRLEKDNVVAWQGLLQSCHQKIQGMLNAIIEFVKSTPAEESAPLAIDFLYDAVHYAVQCDVNGFFSDDTATVREHLAGYMHQYTANQMKVVGLQFETLQPQAPDNTFSVTYLAQQFEQYAKLREKLPKLYEASDAPIEKWVDLLGELVLQYQQSLVEALQVATTGGAGQHERLLKCVQQLQCFDGYIKASAASEVKPLTFKSLYKRFGTAFNSEYFSKLQGVMSAIFAGDFGSAHTLASEDKMLAAGTDLRLLLVGQIDTYMLASINKIKRAIAELTSNVVASPACLQGMMQSYQCIHDAEVLVQGGLLSDSLLNKRDQLLLDAQSALDEWLVAVIAQIDVALKRLDFKLVTQTLDTLGKTLSIMTVKPTAEQQQLQSVTERIHAKIKACQEQFEKPLAKWAAGSVAIVTAAFEAAKEISFEDESYAHYWHAIADQIHKMIDAECTAIEKQFQDGHIGLEAAVVRLEAIQAVTQDTPPDTTQLYVRIKERYQVTVGLIQSNTLENREGEARLKHIEALLVASDRFARSLGSFNLKRAHEFVAERARTLGITINKAFEQRRVANDELVIFADLYSRFSNKVEVLKRDQSAYKQKLAELALQACEQINDARSHYSVGTDQPQALKNIHVALVTLVAIQQLAMNTQGRVSFVESDLSIKVVNLLLEFKQLLHANSEEFDRAVSNRFADNLPPILVVAQLFQSITLEIERFINACGLTTLPPDFYDLKQLNSEYSYLGLRNKLLTQVRQIKTALVVLKPELLSSEGQATRELFYGQLKRDIQFISGLPVILQDHIDARLLSEKAMEPDYGLAACLQAITKFVEEAFRLANNQLIAGSMPSVVTNWEGFYCYYQELVIFVRQCAGLESLAHLQLSRQALLGLKGDDTVRAPTVARFLARRLGRYINKALDQCKKKHIAGKNRDKNDQALVALLSGLQKMSEDMPALVEKVKVIIKGFLSELKVQYDNRFIMSLAEKLRDEESGYGAKLVADQPVFAGMMTAERNRATKSQGINYVLAHLEVIDEKSGRARTLRSDETQWYANQYKEFLTKYDKIIKTYITPEMDFLKFSKVHLNALHVELLSQVAKLAIQRDLGGDIIWSNKIISAMPTLCAYLFAIWSLKESTSFFDATNTDTSEDYLKQPHPAQLVAIFQMLSQFGSSSQGLQSHFNEVLTGQGKSVVLAVTASLLVLLGFAVDVGCYSEYLSGRDASTFEWMFKLLKVDPYIKYGTFNQLSENMLNETGDLRDLMRAVVDSPSSEVAAADPGPSNAGHGRGAGVSASTAAKAKPSNHHHDRQTIALVDEVDSLVTAFFGHLYQPYFLLQSNKIDYLLDAIWTRHRNGTLRFLSDIYRLPEYKALSVQYKHCEYILRCAAREMYEDLSKYKREQGHDFYVNSSGELYYKHFDGTTMSKSIGYRTYWACRDSAHVTPTYRKKHQGIKVTCGAYSYVDLMLDQAVNHGRPRYRAMLGVTGTLRELTPVEKSVVKEVFGIKGASYIPSAHGKTKLIFNEGQHVKVVANDEFARNLYQEITFSRLGIRDVKACVRPVLCFFDTEEELESFYQSKEFQGYRKQGALRMTAKTITNAKERDAFISKATRLGQITLAVKEHGRGSDFILSAKKILMNGGMQVIDAFVPETEAEQRQHQGRAGRMGQDGSFAMVIKESELINKFQLTTGDIKRARDNGKLYELISNARNKKFTAGYQELVDESQQMKEQVHTPSMALLNTLRDAAASREDKVAAHKYTIVGGGAQVEQREANVLVLFDATGSMGNLIDALKATLIAVVTTLDDILGEHNCTFKLQMASYKDYHQRPGGALQAMSGWTCDATLLSEFISSAKASGGGGNSTEAVELGLYHANQLASAGEDRLDHVILIGDEPPTDSQDKINGLRQKYDPENNATGAYINVRYYEREVEDLKAKGVPVSTFFTRTRKFEYLKDSETDEYLTQRAFKQIADETGGESGELNLSNSDEAVRAVTDLFARKVIGEIAADDDSFANDLMSKFRTRMQQYSK